MAVRIKEVKKWSYAFWCGVRAGDMLLEINGHEICDFLDYDFYKSESGANRFLLENAKGKRWEIRFSLPEDEKIGWSFDSFLMDKERRCHNNCVFCFIDQMPKGMRQSLYFKDDDSRLSFLFGNYITLTNLSERDVTRILEMHISPVNVSVHTTNPELRCKMMNNRFAGESLDILKTFAAHGIALNCQLVLCPGWNDGEELTRSLNDLLALGDAVRSVSAVPVGLTAHREGLTPLRLFEKEEAADVLERIEAAAQASFAKDGFYRFHASDEFYILAGKELPETRRYDDFPQLENGVGMCVNTANDFHEALEAREVSPLPFEKRKVTVATGKLAAPMLQILATAAQKKFAGLEVQVVALENKTFGETITVAGLLAGRDLLEGLQGLDLGDAVLITEHMLESEGKFFLDDLTPEAVSEKLGTKIWVVEDNGESFLDALLGQDA